MRSSGAIVTFGSFKYFAAAFVGLNFYFYSGASNFTVSGLRNFHFPSFHNPRR
jgi:hypothetical protein